MLTLLFIVWLIYVTFKLGWFAVKAGWSIVKTVFFVVILPLTIIGLLIGGIIHLTVPILIVIGLITVSKALFGERV